MAQTQTLNLVQRAQRDIRAEKERAIAYAQQWIAYNIKNTLRDDSCATSMTLPMFMLWDNARGLCLKDLPVLRTALKNEGVEMTITKSCGFVFCYLCHCCCDQREMELRWKPE